MSFANPSVPIWPFTSVNQMYKSETLRMKYGCSFDVYGSKNKQFKTDSLEVRVDIVSKIAVNFRAFCFVVNGNKYLRITNEALSTTENHHIFVPL